MSNDIAQRRVAEVLQEVGLAAVARRRIGGFSLGMKQRLGVAAALLGDPPVVLFDEPFNGLDAEGAAWIRGLFRRLAAEGRTVLVSSHVMAEMELVADRVVVIGRGALIAEEPIGQFAARSAGPPRVTVRAPDPGALADRLAAEGAQVRRTGDATLVATGLPASRISQIAFDHRILLHEISPHTASLEEVFMELTADSVDYATENPR